MDSSFHESNHVDYVGYCRLIKNNSLEVSGEATLFISIMAIIKHMERVDELNKLFISEKEHNMLYEKVISLLTNKSKRQPEHQKDSFESFVKEMLCFANQCDLDITFTPNGINILDGKSERQGKVSIENLLRWKESHENNQKIRTDIIKDFH